MLYRRGTALVPSVRANRRPGCRGGERMWLCVNERPVLSFGSRNPARPGNTVDDASESDRPEPPWNQQPSRYAASRQRYR
jgi:hypothetical protein